MIALLLIIIAILLFVISQNIRNSANNSETHSNFTTKPSPEINTKPIQTLSYWQRWKMNNPNEAKIIENTLDRNLEIETDRDIKEIINAYTNMARANNLKDWNQIKPFILDKFSEMVDTLGEEQAFVILNTLIQEESERTKAKTINTGTYIATSWLKQTIEETKNISPTSKHILKDRVSYSFMTTKSDIDQTQYNKENNPIELFRKNYNSQIMSTLGNNINIPLFANGYDSPIAREIMNIMYSYLKNNEFIEKARSTGILQNMIETIIEETNKITDKYCNADVQECIEYYLYPEKPVITSKRCPSCGSREVSCEDYCKCFECGNQWYAKPDRNIYIKI
ncbi:MAG: hypothetical protein K2H44_07250 [Muribaculaceae bacterium]|nr:hypothetical protein [Muribaculaceae bacterium]